jgi:hypothetical protein
MTLHEQMSSLLELDMRMSHSLWFQLQGLRNLTSIFYMIINYRHISTKELSLEIHGWKDDRMECDLPLGALQGHAQEPQRLQLCG